VAGRTLFYQHMQLWSESFIPTLKESPADAEIASHRLLLRAGLIRKVGAGIYAWLPAGYRSLRKIEGICREELNRAGGIEVHLPAIHPAELWIKGPRWDAAREVMFRADAASAETPEDERKGEPSYVLGPTHEEVITSMMAKELTSYRDLPKNFYQIQTKFRNEIRPRFGLMRSREFLMKDGYSFDATDEGAIATYHKMMAAYTAFFSRCGLNFVMVEADTGVMGGSYSHEFMAPAEVGDDDIFFCSQSDYASNREKAFSAIVPEDFRDPEAEGEPEEFPTPGVTTIAGLAEAPYGIPAEKQFKTLIYIGDGRPFAVVLRGQDELEESKLGALGFLRVRPAEESEVVEVMGARPGSLGVVRGTIAHPEKLSGIHADHAVRLIGTGVTGANRDGFHLRNINVKRDLAIDGFGDFRRVRPGEPCPKSGAPLEMARAIEVGHIFKLGTKYSENFEAYFSDAEGKSRPHVMGCYGIGLSRTLQAAIEQSHDDKGIAWPWTIAPYQVLLTLLDPDLEEARSLAIRLAAAAEAAGADVLVDDRNERPGVKFNDADLLGIPLRIVIGGRGLKEGVIELKDRKSGEVRKIALTDAEKELRAAIEERNRAAEGRT
jgi:prolyl-tRNA synthetase